jgi:hypothetical protein
MNNGSRTMRRMAWAVPAVSLIGVATVVLAAAVIWLVLREPVMVADAVAARDPGPIVRMLVLEMMDALRALVRYL